MLSTSDKKLIKKGAQVSSFKIYQADKIWSRYSNDKVNIGEELAGVIRVLNKAFPLSQKLRALSVGSSAEPQFRILETAFRGGLYLLDIDTEALGAITERVARQYTDHVVTICGDYNKIFSSPEKTAHLLKNKLGLRKVTLVTMHHSLYYCDQENWHTIFENIYKSLLAPKGAIHVVLMASKDKNPCSTTSLYNCFVSKFFGYQNNQSLIKFKQELERKKLFKNARISLKTNKIKFFTDDFEDFMAVIWMILLYPNVHKYDISERREIAEFVYKKIWKKKLPIIQSQDYLTLYRGI